MSITFNLIRQKETTERELRGGGKEKKYETNLIFHRNKDDKEEEGFF